METNCLCRLLPMASSLLVKPATYPGVGSFLDSGDTASNLGSAVDELMRHQPTLKTDATTAIIKVLHRGCRTCFGCCCGLIVKATNWLVSVVTGRDLQPRSSPRVHLPETVDPESRWHGGGAPSPLQPRCWGSLKWGRGGRGGPAYIQPAAGGTREQQTVSATWTVWRWVHNTVE